MTSLLPPTIKLDGHGLRIGIVVARYNWNVTGAMLDLAQDELHTLGVTPQDISVVLVPGAFEIATVTQAMAQQKKHDALITFGCVMKGSTRHDVVIADTAARGIQQIALESGIPIIFGIMCAENQEQAIKRIPRGRECAQAAVEMVQALRMVKYEIADNITYQMKGL